MTMTTENTKSQEGDAVSSLSSSDMLDAEHRKYKALVDGFNAFVKAGCPGSEVEQLRQHLKAQEELSNRLLQRCFDAESDLRGTKASIVHELELAGVTRTYDDEEIDCGNYLQGIRILRDRANSSNNKG